MMGTKRIECLTVALFLFILGCTGCTMGEELLLPTGHPSNALSFELNIPGHKIPHVSRAMASDENTVETLDVLLFSPLNKGVRMFRRHERIIGYTMDTERKILARLKLSPEEAGCDVVFIANAAEAVATIDATDTKVTALEKLTATQLNQWEIETMPIPMYGEVTLAGNDIQEGKKIEGIHLIRMLARIDVRVSPAVLNFTLDRVYLCNRYQKGYIAPRWESDGSIVKGENNQPNYSFFFPFEDNQAMPGEFLETYPDISYEADPDHNSCTGQIYTFEAPGNFFDEKNIAATCLIIKGYIDDDLSEAHYYRVDFTNAQGEFKPLLRNHQYVVEVTAVNGPGYQNVEDALRSYTVISNMYTRTLVWDNEMISHINFNGQYMLGVQYEEMIFSSAGETLDNFIVTDYEYGITIVKKPDWVELVDFTDGDTEAFLQVRIGNNPHKEERTGSIELRAGRLTHSILVKQNRGSSRWNSEVNIASFVGTGFLGYDDGTGVNGAEAMRKVLDTHFKMGGTVELKQINYHAITDNSMITDNYLNDKDVVVLGYNALPTATVMNRLIYWLATSPKRVLVLSFDRNTTNAEAFKLHHFSKDFTFFDFSPLANHASELVHTPGTEYFWKDGPFTQGEEITSATYLFYGAFIGRATLSNSSRILPLFKINGGMTFGVNMQDRVVYVSDSEYGKQMTGDSFQEQRFNNSRGEVNNPIEKILSNIWAWIIDEVVLKE